MRRRSLLPAAAAVSLALAGCSSPKPFSAAFDVAVTFTPAATKALKAQAATTVVDVLYTGQPTEKSKPLANEDGLVEMGEDLATLEGTSQTVHIAGNGFEKPRLNDVRDGKVVLNVRAYADNSHIDAIIKCTSLTVPVAVAQTKPQQINCDAA